MINCLKLKCVLKSLFFHSLFHFNFVFAVVWITAVIAISILGLVVGVLFGGPTTCLNQQSGAQSRTATTTTTRTTANGAGAAAEKTSPIKGVSKTTTTTTTSTVKTELINTEKYTTFDIHKQQEQESGSQDKRNSTCKPDHTVPVSWTLYDHLGDFLIFCLHLQMLSVQTPGCAGMERLGVPTRTTITSSATRDER